MRSLRVLSLAVVFLGSLVSPATAQPPVETDQGVVACEEVFTEQCPSHASGGRPEFGPHLYGSPTDVVTVLRVGLRTTTFNAAGGVVTEMAGHDHAIVRVTGTAGDFHVIDLSTDKQIVAPAAGQEVAVRFTSAYEVSLDGIIIGTFAGPIRFRSSDSANTYKVLSIRRSLFTPSFGREFRVPEYYGEVEIARGPSTAAGTVNLVNLVPLENYVPGVVVNESIASFHVDALKAQAVAARGYALANKDSTRFGRPYGLDDSTASQVYRGKGSEHPSGNAAVVATEGLVGSYAGRIITAFYSSSMGGHTENNEWIFNSPSTQWPGTNAEPYLRGIYDGEGPAPDLSTDAGIASFWKSESSVAPVGPATVFDSCPRVNNRFARWIIEIPAATLKTRMAGRSTIVSGDLSGTITGLEVLERMAASRRVGIVRVTLSSGVADVKGWDNVRRVFGTSLASKPWACTTPGSTIAANFVLNNPSVIESQYVSGVFSGIVSYGGGWGHNVGMSQFGAQGRALAGQSFLTILKAYYTGIDVGSYPIEIGLRPGGGVRQLRQTFASPNAAGTLRITPSGGMQGLTVHINDTCDLRFTEEQLAAPVIDTDVSDCLVAGTNVVQYNPSGARGTATVLVIVE
ncbi:MAG: SpoIID/LytB domain-containing protein [Candidatus Limnocylindria bacterium]